jgi:GR25 family glycosyltransferase involved in LPS biosynthesis
MQNIYKLVDEIYCINLITRNDRYETMNQFASSEDIKITYFRPERHPKGGRMGCFTSHLKIIKHAYDTSQNMILIFEDDIIKTESYNKINHDEIVSLIKNNKNWEILQLGWFDIFNSLFNIKKESTNISQFGSRLTSSYIINRKGMKRILDTYKEYIDTYHVDRYYQLIFDKTMYNIIPIIFDQDRKSVRNNIWINKHIDDMIVYIDLKLNFVYNLSLFKYYNGYIIVYLLILFIIYKLIITKIK